MLAIALPMVISTACDGVMTFTDRLFLARLSSEEMNAAMSGGVMLQALTFFFVGLTGYSTALVAQYLGSGQKHLSSVASFQAIIVVLCASPFILLCSPLAVFFSKLMHIPEGQMGFQIIYFNVLLYGVPVSLLRTCLSSYFSGIGKTKIVMFANLIAMVVNVGLDYILIFGKFGFPQMGIKGAAVATVLGGVCGLAMLFASYFGKTNRTAFSVMKSFRFDKKIMKNYLYYGYPAGLELFLNFFAFSFCIFVFHSQGSHIATATTIMFNWDMVSYIPLLGVEIAVTSLAGRYMGAGEPETVSKVMSSGVKTGILYSFVILLLFVFCSDYLVNVFHPDTYSAIFEQAKPIANSMIRVASFYVLAEAIMVALIGALRGAGDTHFTMIASVALHWTFAPVLFVLLNFMGVSALNGWIVLILLYLVFCYIMFLRYKSGKWKKIKMV